MESKTIITSPRRERGTNRMPRPGAVARRGPVGFTLLEVTIVLVLASLTLGVAALYFGRYYRRTSAQRAAQIFAQDLTLARSAALRARAPVVIRFDEDSLWYSITQVSSGTELDRRRFGRGGDFELSAIDLQTAGDSLRFNSRGVASLSGGTGSLGVAAFSYGAVTYEVRFNSMGASKVQEK